MRCLQFCALRGSLHLAICGVNASRMDRTSACSLLQPWRPYNALPTALCIKRLAAFSNLRRQYLEDGSHFRVLAAAALEAIQCVADSLCTKRLAAFSNLRRQCAKDGSHFRVLAAAALEAIQCVADSLSIESRVRFQVPSQGLQQCTHFRVVAAAMLQADEARGYSNVVEARLTERQHLRCDSVENLENPARRLYSSECA